MRREGSVAKAPDLDRMRWPATAAGLPNSGPHTQPPQSLDRIHQQLPSTFASIKERHPILVTGSHRSGTTWVGQMLATKGTTYIFEPFNIENASELHAFPLEFWFTYIDGLSEARRAKLLSDLSDCLSFRYQPPIPDHFARHFSARLKFSRSLSNLSNRVRRTRPPRQGPYSLVGGTKTCRSIQYVCRVHDPAPTTFRQQHQTVEMGLSV